MKPHYFIIAMAVFIQLSCSDSTSRSKLTEYEKIIEERVDSLLSLMTIEEKVRQLDMYKGSELVSNGKLDTIKASPSVDKKGIGSIHDFYPASAKDANEVQRYIVGNSRLGIPAIIIEEGLHGYQGVKATTFPVPIGIGSTWNPDLVYKAGRVIGTEARSKNVHMLLAPTLGIGRDPRWGRVEETYSEDTYLASEIGVSFVKGLQGDDLAANNTVVSEPKHFGVHSAPAGGRNTASVFVGEREARSFFLPVFEKAVKEGNAQGIMAAYHELDGVPCAANSWLLTDILRKEWGFNGMVVSDLAAVRRLHFLFKTGEDPKSAIIQSLEAGLDMQFYDFTHEVFQGSIIEAINAGEMKVDVLDRAVRRVLRVKFKLGLFDNPYIDEALEDKVYHSKAHQEIAKQVGRESITLIKNEGNILPITKEKVKTIALLGDLSNIGLLGGYSPKNVETVTVLEGIQKKLGNDFELKHCKGISVTQYSSSISPENIFVEEGEHGIMVEYFNNLNLEGEPALVRHENDFVMGWYNLSPAPGIDDQFSARINCLIKPDITGKYKIHIKGWTNKTRFYLDGEMIYDGFGDDHKFHNYINLDLKANQHYAFKIEFSKAHDFARLNVNWSIIERTKGSENQILKKAIDYAKTSDIALVVLGENAAESGEGKDKMNLNFDEAEKELLYELSKTGTPVVLILTNGRPITMPWAAKHIPAILETWYAGEFQGDAVADVLFGDYNPSGRLPISFPKHVGQVPIFYNHKASFGHTYVDSDAEPLFSFGHGLSYTSFDYTNLQLSKKEIQTNESVKVSVDITNSGKLAGEDVVQLYINDIYSSIATPVIELKGFEKVFLEPGETKTIEFDLGFDELHLWNIDMKKVVEPGDFAIMIGKSCKNIVLKDVLTVVSNK